MKLHGNQLTSEGKLLEIIPIINDANGVPYMLPPVVWHVPNWLAGFRDDHVQHTPCTLWVGHTMNIPGSNASMTSRLSMQVRILEDSPSVGTNVVTVDASAVEALVRAFRDAHGLSNDSLS